ncbi:MAG: hypothetical protein ABSD42_10320 [Candidatus Bathyarchaeia archaeon]
MNTPSPKNTGLKSWFKERTQKRKDKEEQEHNVESRQLKIITFLVTLVAMSFGMSFLPLFPQPLPIILAVLVAFITFQYPMYGMPIGGAVVGLGLMYHLAELHFISYLGGEPIRTAVVVVWMTLFIGLPIVFRHYKSALAIDFGILAVTLLLFAPTYFLAIPLILASAVYFKKYVALTIVYYVLISVPLQILQYFEYTVAPIVRSDWWNAAGSSPPLFISLNSIFADLNSSIGQFRLYDTSQVVYAITGQLTWHPTSTGRTLSAALSQYLDSAPGIFMFIVIVVGLAFALIYFTRIFVKEGSIGVDNKIFPCFTATIAAALFFILLSALQVPLAFTADVSASTIVLGTLATLLFTLPVAFIDYAPKQTTTTSEITDKAKALMGRLQVFEGQLNVVKANIPVVVSSPEGKMLVIKDSLEDTIRKSEAHFYETTDLDKKFEELEKLGKDIDGLESELNTILSEYQIFVSCEFSNWVGKLKDSGLNVKSTVNADFQKEMPLDERIEVIKQTLESGRILAQEVVQIAEPIYGIIRPLYDPSLPEKSRAIEFTLQKLEQKESPWIAIEALYSSLNNWKRQYGADILDSVKYLKNSLTPIADLSSAAEVLPPIFGENLPKVLDYAKKAELMKLTAEKKIEKDQLNIVDVIALKDDIQSFLGIAKDVLSMLYAEMISEEDSIERLLPTKDYLWETESTLRERLKKATETLSNPSNYKINQIMENLPNYLSYVDEAVQTLEVYNERREFLLNYPTAEAAIEELLKQKKLISPQDLPFQTKFAGEYLRLYYTQRFGEFAFDKENLQLTKKS